MYGFESRVRFSECDERGVLSVVGLVDYLQDCSTFHTDSLGMGIHGIDGGTTGWVLAAWSIDIAQLPSFGETIVVGTWCYDLRGFQAMRNFTVRDADGNLLVAADSQWVLYDWKAKGLTRIPDSQLCCLSGEGRLDAPRVPRRIRVTGEGRPAGSVMVTRQHLDTNRHVNNAQYILIALEALSELGMETPMRGISVQYRNMAWLGDELRPIVHELDGSKVVELLSDTGQPYAVVSFTGRQM